MSSSRPILNLLLVLSLILCSPLDRSGGAELLLAKDGRTTFSIVTSPQASPVEQFAAGELQHYLRLMTGASFGLGSKLGVPCIVVSRRDSPPTGVSFPVSATHLAAEGFLLAARHGNLLLVGADERGTLYGVYALLERLGCSWLAPAFDFYQGASETVPRREVLSLSLPSDTSEQPVLKYRKLYVEEGRSHTAENLRQLLAWMPKRRFNTLVVPLNYAGGGRVMWDNWRRGLTPELRRRGLLLEVGGHGYENYLNAQMEDGQLFARHPDWFGLDEAGQRVKSARAVFCTSNRDATDYLVRNVLHYLDAHPEIEIFDFWPPDGARWCECTNCLALGTPSDRQALLLAQVASAAHARNPGLKFETIAYAACLAPPAKAALDPEVLVDFCPIAQCFEVPIQDPASAQNARYVAQLKSWRSTFKGDISIYSYYRKYAWQSLPVLLPHYLQTDLRFYRGLGLRGISTYSEPGDWGAYELNHYVLGGLAWNPEADVDAMIREFAEARFGSQASLACKAYQVLEENVRHICSLPGTTLKTSDEYARVDGIFTRLSAELVQERAGTTNTSVGAALNRLALSLDYAQRDLRLEQAVAEKKPVSEAALEGMANFLEAHAGEGVFVPGRLDLAKRYRKP